MTPKNHYITEKRETILIVKIYVNIGNCREKQKKSKFKEKKKN